MSPIDGLTIGAGSSTNTSSNLTTNATGDTKEIVGHIVYSTGPISVGYRMAESDSGVAGTAASEIEGYSIAFNVNDNFAVSYGQQDFTKKAIAATAAVTEEVNGVSAAYTVGSASIRINHSKSSNDGRVAAVDDETTEIGVVLSF
jgi:hypothetical protein